MTTKKEKKSLKKSKAVKSGSPAGKMAKRTKVVGERSKVVAKSPVAGEIDKEKMAAFFSADGLEEPVDAAEKPKTEPVAAVMPQAPVQAPPVEKKIDSEIKVAEVTVPEVTVAKVVNEDQNLEKNKGEIKMTTTAPVKSSSKNSGSISFLPIFVILFCMAAFWFYYISSAPSPKAAATMIEQGQAQILKLEKKVKSLQAVIAGLKAELKDAQSSALQNQAAAVKKAAPKKTVKDSSFAKAPVPFWRNYQHPHAKQLEKLNQNKKSTAVKAVGSAKGDSFSKAPVPFWRK